MNRRITIATLLCLIGLWSAATSADKINPPPIAEINQKPPVQPPKLPPVTLPTELPKPPRVDSSGGHLDNRLRQLEEGELLPGLEGGEGDDRQPRRDRAVSLDDFPAMANEVGSVTVTRVVVVSDRVIKTGSKISGGWREYAADLSWRRVVFTLDGRVATVVFGDGKPGSRLPSVTRFARSGPGPNGSPATYNEVRTFAGASPGILDKAKTSSQIPSDVATRIREIGGDIQAMQQFAEFMRISELGSAFDAARGPADDGGFFPDRPGGSPGKGNWSAPWRGVGRGGPASSDGDVVVSSDTSVDADGRRSSSTTRHGDNSTTTVTAESNTDGSSSSSTTRREADGDLNYDRTESTDSNGNSVVSVISVDRNTGELQISVSTKSSDGSLRVRTSHTAPSEVPYSGRGGFDEAWLAQHMPWMMDAYYAQWKRENDLVKSGGRIKQPGRGVPTLVLNEGPEVGASGVVNCGAETNPCARPAGVAVDPRRGWGNISQPGRGEPGTPTGPIGGQAEPRPIPVPEPQ